MRPVSLRRGMGQRSCALWPMLFSRRRITEEENDVSKLQDQIITLRETVAVLYGLYSQLSENPDLVERVSVIGEEGAKINTAAMHLRAGIRKLEVARACLARALPPVAPIAGPVEFHCNLYGRPRTTQPNEEREDNDKFRSTGC